MSYRQLVRERAQDHYGYVTTRDVAELDVPAVELRKLAARGALTAVSYGLYRVNDVPPTARDVYAEAVLRVGADAYLVQDAVLALHALGQVNPRRIRVGTPHRVRASLPTHIEAIRLQVPPEDLTEYEGIACTTVARAIRDCRGLVMDDRLLDATRRAEREGLLTRREAAGLKRTLRRPQTPR